VSVEDRLDILQVISLYGFIIDDGALDRLNEIFTDDAVLAPTLTPPWNGMDEIRHYFADFVPNQPIPTIAHHMTNPVVDVAADGLTARARSKTLGIRKDLGFVTGEYRDEFVKTDQGWRIRRREIIRRTRFSTDPVESDSKE
jgi:ketosteroid isomerase-like protein